MTLDKTINVLAYLTGPTNQAYVPIIAFHFHPRLVQFHMKLKIFQYDSNLLMTTLPKIDVWHFFSKYLFIKKMKLSNFK